MVMSRFRLKSVVLLPFALRDFASLSQSASEAAGYLRGTFGVAGVRTIINLSIWRSREQMLQWTGSRKHVDAVRRMYRWSAESWSAEAIEPAISRSATTWNA